ncbi:hypothetical protein [Tomitella gaofuii]|uniref:hypothetical protein n=1 Tax=Tomitella gaofuii TaxID=2760083 RepID=UPI0015F8501E|nr:hypothetical protein [Tomitella gaofuii]
MIGIVFAAGAGYVLGTKAGRRRYEQISRAAKAIAESPATRTALDAGRQRLSEALSTEPRFTRIESIDDETSVYIPEAEEQRR